MCCGFKEKARGRASSRRPGVALAVLLGVALGLGACEPPVDDGSDGQLDQLRACRAREDCTPPKLRLTAPGDGATVSGTVTVAGTASDKSGVTSVEVRVDDGAWRAASGTTSFSLALDTTLLVDGDHEITARATDPSGNQALASVGVVVANATAPPPPPPPPPPSAPTVAITWPAPGASVSGTIQITGTAADEAGVAWVEVRTDAGAWVTATGTTAWSQGLDTRALADGAHALSARATNVSGLVTATTITINVANVSPPLPAGLAVSISSPGAGAVLSGIVTVTGKASGASRLRVRTDSLAYLEIPVAATWSYRFDSRALANGPHTLLVVADDASGGAATAQLAYTASNANAAPELRIVTPAAGATVAGLVSVSGFARDPNGVGQVGVAVDGGAFVTTAGFGGFTYDLDTTTLTNGAHVLWARVVDDLGVSRMVSVPVTVANSDLRAPGVTITSPAAGATVSGVVTIRGAASDDQGVARVEVRERYAAYVPATGTGQWSLSLDTHGLSNGTHTLDVRAWDQNGNAGTASVTVTVANGYAKTTWVSPEGVTIKLDTVAGWSPAAIYQMLQRNARDLDVIGPTLTITIDDNAGASAQVGCSSSSCTSTIHLGSAPGAKFAIMPEVTLTHEYGHAWSLTYLALAHGGDWSSYLQQRGLALDPRLDSVYPTWDRREIIADDYRELFGTPAASSWSRREVPHPADVAGLADFLASVWASP